MATTTNYGWTTPDDTALVKDGASAIRTLGSSIDTTTKALNPSTTLGDIEYRSSTANTNTRLGIGSSGNVLTVSGGVPTWAAPAAGGAYTLISTTALTGASITISSIPSTYEDLYFIFENPRTSTDGDNFRLRFNADSTANRHNQTYNANSSTGVFDATFVDFVGNTDNSLANGMVEIRIPNYANTNTWKFAHSFVLTNNYNSPNTWTINETTSIYNQTSAISSMEFFPRFGNWNNGTVYLYGVK